MQETRLAWLAGVIDSEGCIGIFRKTQKHRSGNITIVPTPFITIVNSSHTLMKECGEIIEELGISAYGLHMARNDTNRPMKRFLIKNHQSLRILLVAIIPYLIGKREQALVMLEYLDKYGGRKGMLDERMPYFDRLHELKRSDLITP